MNKKLTKKETEAYSLVQSIRGKALVKKIGRKGMSKLGKKGAKVRWDRYFKLHGKKK